MSRPFAVIGFTVFLTLSLLYNKETGVTAAVLVLYAAALVVTLFIDKARKHQYFPCAFASGVVACALLLSTSVFYYQPVAALDGRVCELTATLESEAELKYGNYYYIARATEIDGESVDLKLRLTFSTQPEAEPYDEVSGKFMFYIPGSSSKDYVDAYKADGIFIAAYPTVEGYEVKNIPDSEKPLGKKIIDIRNSIKNAVYRVLPDESGALAVALIIGDKSELSAETLNDFQTVGISHVICVSGLHLSLWSMLVFSFLKKLKIGEKISSVISALAVITFMLIAGMSYSVVRSGIMMLIYLFANLIMRQRDSVNSLGFALAAIAVFNPYAMGSVSLQLSALATLGIILYSQNIAPIINKKISEIKSEFIKKSLRSLVSSLMITVSATAFTLPVSMNLYGGFNFAVFVANLIAVPAASAGMVLCALGAFAGSFVKSVFNIASFAGGLICRFLIWFADSLSEIKWLIVRTDKDETAVIVCAVLSVCLMSLIMAYYGKSMPVLTCVLSAFVFVSVMSVFSLAGRGITKINVVDVGNGTAVVMSRGGENLLIGCGGTQFLGTMYISEVIGENTGKIDAAVIPSSNEYSSGYLGKLLGEYRPSYIYSDSLTHENELLLGDSEKFGLESEYLSENFTVKNASVGSKACTMVKNDDVSVLICYDPSADYSVFPEDFCSADVIIARGDYPQGIENFGSRFVVINAEETRGRAVAYELRSMGIDAAATGGNGNIIVEADNGIVSAYREKKG